MIFVWHEEKSKAFTSSLSTPALLRASSIQVETPSPSGRGSVMWWASVVKAPPKYSAKMFAPRFCACSKDSKTKTPAPSPITKPSLFWSHGREAFAGSSHLVESALRHHNINHGSSFRMASGTLFLFKTYIGFTQRIQRSHAQICAKYVHLKEWRVRWWRLLKDRPMYRLRQVQLIESLLCTEL